MSPLQKWEHKQNGKCSEWLLDIIAYISSEQRFDIMRDTPFIVSEEVTIFALWSCDLWP